jgi:dolichol kinase
LRIKVHGCATVIENQSTLRLLFSYVISSIYQVYLMVYWLLCSFIAVYAVRVQVQHHKHASSAVRKIFHVLIVAVYLPGLAWECTLLYLSSGVALALLILVEVNKIS